MSSVPHPGLAVDRASAVASVVRQLHQHHAATADHVVRVGYLARILADEIGADVDQIAFIERVALVHDVGKLVVPAHLLDFRGALSPGQRAALHRHAEAGGVLIAATPMLSALAQGVRAHHERWDGSGYPDRLAGDAIPFEARVVACADAFDAITFPRSYTGRQIPHRHALERLQVDAGTHFDPELAAAAVPAFARLNP